MRKVCFFLKKNIQAPTLPIYLYLIIVIFSTNFVTRLSFFKKDQKLCHIYWYRRVTRLSWVLYLTIYHFINFCLVRIYFYNMICLQITRISISSKYMFSSNLHQNGQFSIHSMYFVMTNNGYVEINKVSWK